MIDYCIEKICSSYRISDYLSEKGIEPKRRSGDRLCYLCPLPGHANDTNPSFYVFDKGDYEDFHCFACKAGGSIIQFIEKYEQLSIKDVIRKLSQGINLDIEDELDFIVAKIVDDDETKVTDQEIVQVAMGISTICHIFLKNVEFDKEEVKVCDKFFEHVDKYIINRDKEKLVKASDLLSVHLKKRFLAYSERKKQEELERYRNWKM